MSSLETWELCNISILQPPTPNRSSHQIPTRSTTSSNPSTFQASQMLLKIRACNIKLVEDIMSHKQKAPLTFPTCWAIANLCHNKTYLGEVPSKGHTTHLATSMVPWVATSINPKAPPHLWAWIMIHTSNGTIRRPRSPLYIDHRYDLSICSKRFNWARLGNQQET